ncbi:MAG TPA: hypothetical protein DD713_09985, partial [Nitrospiraceae bacterium]|nr:hypothetical protein [Nitrospiraceae bacterium]
MTEVELKLVAPHASAVKSIKEVANEAQKLYKAEEGYTQKRKGLIEKEIQMQKQLSERREKASNIENLKIYNKLLEDSKKRLEDLNKAGVQGNKEVEKSTGGVIDKIGKMAIAYLTVRTAVKLLKETVLAFFTKSQEGMDLLERKISGLKAAVGVLQGEFIKLGKAIAGEGGNEATPWGTRLVNGLRLISTTANLIPGVSKYFDDLADRMNKAGVAAEEYTRITQELARAESDMIVPRAKATAAIADARLKYSESNGTIQERITLLENAIALEREMAESEIKHQQFVTLNLRNRNVELEKRGMLLRTHEEELQRAIAREIELQTASDQRQMRSVNALRALKKEALDEELNYKILMNKWTEEYFDKEEKRQQEDLKLKARMERYTQEYFDKEKKRNQELLDDKALMEKYTNEYFKKDKERLAKLEEIRVDALLKMGTAISDYANIIEQLSQKEVERTQRERELLDTRVDETQSALETEIELYKAGYASNIEAKQKELAELKVERDKALAEEEKARKKQHTIEVASLLAQKAVDVAKIISSTAVANAKAIALSPLTFGQPCVGINTAAAALGIAAAAAAVIAASSAKYAKGGWTGRGGYRDSTGERMAGIVHD